MRKTQTFIVSAVRDVGDGWELLLGTDATGPWITALRDDGWTQPTVGDFVTVQLPVVLAIVSEAEWMQRNDTSIEAEQCRAEEDTAQ